jgi:hypothetical protein
VPITMEPDALMIWRSGVFFVEIQRFIYFEKVMNLIVYPINGRVNLGNFIVTSNLYTASQNA